MDNYKVWPMLSCFSRMFYITRGREKRRKNKKHQKAIPRSFQEVHRPGCDTGLRKRKNYFKKWKEKTRDKTHHFLFISIDRNCCEPSTSNTTWSPIINQRLIDSFPDHIRHLSRNITRFTQSPGALIISNSAHYIIDTQLL